MELPLECIGLIVDEAERPAMGGLSGACKVLHIMCAARLKEFARTSIIEVESGIFTLQQYPNGYTLRSKMTHDGDVYHVTYKGGKPFTWCSTHNLAINYSPNFTICGMFDHSKPIVTSHGCSRGITDATFVTLYDGGEIGVTVDNDACTGSLSVFIGDDCMTSFEFTPEICYDDIITIEDMRKWYKGHIDGLVCGEQPFDLEPVRDPHYDDVKTRKPLNWLVKTGTMTQEFYDAWAKVGVRE